MPDGPRAVIRGGAGPTEAAAIAAAIQHLLELESAARADPPPRPRLSPWVRSAFPGPMTGPLRPTTHLSPDAWEDGRAP